MLRTLAALHVSLTAAAAGAGIAAPALAADYYAGKTIELVVGGDAGGGYDIYARAVARHLGQHIPGNPTVVVKNMPGAGSTRAGIYISTVAPKDGSSVGAMMPGAIMAPLLEDRPVAQFDPTKVIYIGTADSGVRVCLSFHNSRIKTFEDAQKERSKAGATAAGGATRDYALLHNRTAGTKFDVVAGYKGTTEIALALERGEVDGLCGWDWSSVKSQKADWLRDKKVNVLVQVALDPEPELTRLGVPQIWNYVTGEENRKIAELVVSQQVFMRSYIVPPGTPAEQVGILRKAFDETVKDPQFLADAEKMQLSITPISGVKVQALIERLYATPKDLIERARHVIKP
jgi:tripartite-type tricarboxylate transporter receptor subunit TctC